MMLNEGYLANKDQDGDDRHEDASQCGSGEECGI